MVMDKSDAITIDDDDVVIVAEVTKVVPSPLSDDERRCFETEAGKRFRSFRCPITMEPFTMPVQAADGFTYDESAISQWVAQRLSHGLPITSPSTNKPMQPGPFLVNFSLMAAMREVGAVLSATK